MNVLWYVGRSDERWYVSPAGWLENSKSFFCFSEKKYFLSVDSAKLYLKYSWRKGQKTVVRWFRLIFRFCFDVEYTIWILRWCAEGIFDIRRFMVMVVCTARKSTKKKKKYSEKMTDMSMFSSLRFRPTQLRI
jgi:hypothetical protein